MKFIKGYRRWLAIASSFAVMLVNNIDVGITGDDVNLIATNVGNIIAASLGVWSIFDGHPPAGAKTTKGDWND